MTTSDISHLDIVVGELALSEGRRQSDAPHMALMMPPRRAHGDRRSETLVVFLDLGGGGAGGLARAMLENFERAFWRCSGPVTSALRHAMAAANTHLREENRLLPIPQRRRAGLVCAVLRADDVYLAQVGPAKALLVHGEQVLRFPKDNRDQLPLGVASGLNIQFSYSALYGGDRLLLTGESWTAGLTENDIGMALSASDNGAEEVMLVLEQQAGRKTFSALVVQCAALALSAAVPATPVAGRAREETASVWQVGGAATQERGPERVPAEVAGTADGAREHAWAPARPLLASAFDRARLDRSRQRLRHFGLAVSDSMRMLFMRVLPEPEPALPRRRRRSGVTENVVMMAGIAIAIPLLVAFVVVTFYLQRSATERREALSSQAVAAVEAARQADPTDARAHWEAALLAAQEALQIAPDDEELDSMYAESRARLDELDGIVRPELITLWNYGGGEGRRLAASRMQVFVLDPEQDQVTQQTLSQERRSVTGDNLTLVAYRGETVGESEVGELRNMVWLGAGGGRSGDILLILTADNVVLQHSLSWGLSWIPFATEPAADNVQAMSAYDGRLYILDTEENTIWRFPPDGNGFGEAQHYFRVPPPDLSTAMDMTIDGAVYVLLEDGQVVKFFGGEPESFQLQDLPQPLVRPVALASEGDVTSGALYVADAGTDSILAFTKAGRFIYQIRADAGALAELEALAVENESRTLYVLASGKLYALALPRVPEMSGTSE